MRAVRAGEAKLCVRVRRSSLTLGLGVASSPPFRAVWRAIVAAMRMGFEHFCCFFYGSRLGLYCKKHGF